MRFKSIVTALSAAVLAAGLAGCGGPEKNAQYETLNDLGAAYEYALGDECSETLKDDIQNNDWNFTHCGDDATIMLFTSDAKREEIKANNPLQSGERWVQGGNWLIQADQFKAEEVHAALGGELLDS